MQPRPLAADHTSLGSYRPSHIFRYARVGFWICVAVPVVAWFLATLAWPFGRDQGILAWVGHVIRSGGMPYKDAWEVKGPTAFLPYTLVELIFGRNMWGIRVFDLLTSGAGMFAVYQVCRAWWDRRTGWYAVVILAFCMMTLDFWLTAQPDTWCGWLITIAIALLAGAVRPVDSLRFAAAAACLSLCVIEKPVYLIYLFLLIPGLVWKRRQGQLWQAVATSAAGFVLPVIVLLAWFAARGALVPFFETFILYNIRTHAQIEFFSAADQFISFFWWLRSEPPFCTFVLPALLGGILLLRTSKLPALLFGIWLMSGIVFVVIQRKYYPYHWYPLFPWLAAGTAITLRRGCKFLLPLPSRWNLRCTITEAVLLWLALLYVPLAIHPVREWIDYRLGHLSRGQYQTTFVFNNESYYWFPRIDAIANYIHDHTLPDQSVLVWGFDVGINYLSDRMSPTRFGYAYPLETGANTPYEAPYRKEFLNQFRGKPPVYVVVSDGDGNRLVSATSKQTLDQYVELNDFLREHYAVETVIYGWDIWRLKK